GLQDVREFDASGLELDYERGTDALLNVSAALTADGRERYLETAFRDWVENAEAPHWADENIDMDQEATEAEREQAWDNDDFGLQPNFDYTLAEGGDSVLTLDIEQAFSEDEYATFNLWAYDAVDDDLTDEQNDRFNLVNNNMSFENVNVDGGAYDEDSDFGNTLEVARSIYQGGDETSEFASIANINTLVLADTGQANPSVDADLTAA
ncbi:hypothetical protein, partial [Halorhodospira sp. 9622]|uniref:hypothetical protein n=1 Tax=Halorhodospira sp. 9622 TaxID=2899136 RepID=UPI001EE7CC66